MKNMDVYPIIITCKI